jgi:hypothetical protein
MPQNCPPCPQCPACVAYKKPKWYRQQQALKLASRLWSEGNINRHELMLMLKQAQIEFIDLLAPGF